MCVCVRVCVLACMYVFVFVCVRVCACVLCVHVRVCSAGFTQSSCSVHPSLSHYAVLKAVSILNHRLNASIEKCRFTIRIEDRMQINTTIIEIAITEIHLTRNHIS